MGKFKKSDSSMEEWFAKVRMDIESLTDLKARPRG
jgi:hypothetical protein